jgi:magnesium-transporting ATPase (P-type)
LKSDPKVENFNNLNILKKGTILQSTYILGLVLYTSVNCFSKETRQSSFVHKSSKVDRKIRSFTIFMLFTNVLVSVLSGLLYRRIRTFEGSQQKVSSLVGFVSHFSLYLSVMPLSLTIYRRLFYSIAALVLHLRYRNVQEKNIYKDSIQKNTMRQYEPEVINQFSNPKFMSLKNKNNFRVFNPNVIADMGDVDDVFFDKTGTLATTNFEVRVVATTENIYKTTKIDDVFRTPGSTKRPLIQDFRYGKAAAIFEGIKNPEKKTIKDELVLKEQVNVEKTQNDPVDIPVIFPDSKLAHQSNSATAQKEVSTNVHKETLQDEHHNNKMPLLPIGSPYDTPNDKPKKNPMSPRHGANIHAPNNFGNEFLDLKDLALMAPPASYIPSQPPIIDDPLAKGNQFMSSPFMAARMNPAHTADKLPKKEIHSRSKLLEDSKNNPEIKELVFASMVCYHAYTDKILKTDNAVEGQAIDKFANEFELECNYIEKGNLPSVGNCFIYHRGVHHRSYEIIFVLDEDSKLMFYFRKRKKVCTYEESSFARIRAFC